MKTILLLITLSTYLYAEDKARELFTRLTGVPLLSSDPRLPQMKTLIEANSWNEAARIASDDDHFFNVTLRDWASVMSNQKESPFVPFNDFEALVIGIARDGIDARELLTGNFRYEADAGLGLPAVSIKDSQHYLEIEKRNLNPRKILTKHTPQWDGLGDSAGLLTTYTWASEHLVAGTNRRATEYSFQEFLCTPIVKWRDYGLDVSRIRRDVPRAPSGNPATFQNECRTCHAPLDGLTGAFAGFDFANNELLFGKNWVAPKMNQNAEVYPKGYRVKDSSWVNLATEHHNVALGWRGATAGFGLSAFAKMLSESRAFSKCMVKRTYRKICRVDLTDDSLLDSFSTRFEEAHYDLRNLFEEMAVYCVKGAT